VQNGDYPLFSTILTVVTLLLQPRLKPGGSRTFLTGIFLSEQCYFRSERWYIPTQFLTFKRCFTGALRSIALLRCLFRERFRAYFPSRVYSQGSGKSCPRSMIPELSTMWERGGCGPRDGHFQQPTVKRVLFLRCTSHTFLNDRMAGGENTSLRNMTVT